MMKKQLLTLVALMAALGSLTAYTLITNQMEPPSKAPPTSTPVQVSQTTPNNLVSLFLVRKDNLKNEFSGEIYPIALYLNGQYIDASQNVTIDVRDNFQEDRLIALNQQRNVLSAIKNFTVLDGNTSLGQFKVDKLGVSQFACSSLLTGKGEFTGNHSLPTLFEILPKDHAGELKGRMADKEFDQSWRWTIAVSQHTSNPAANQPSLGDAAQYQQDLLTAAKAAIAKSAKPVDKTREAVVERVALFDLNHDGQPEIFGTVRQGRDPKTIQPDQVRRSDQQPITYVNLWLSQVSDRPTVISSQVEPYAYPVTSRPYDVVGTVDIDGNGINEVIVKNNGYEATSFSIYEFKDGQLKSVFSGAGYGC